MNKITFLKSFMQDIWNDKKVEAIEKYLHSDYIIHLDNADPWEGKTLSHEMFKERLMFSFVPFPDIHFDVQSAIEDGNQVAINWIMTGTNTGEIGEFPATNKSIKTRGMTIYHFREDKICGHTQIYDRMTIFKQLGFA